MQRARFVSLIFAFFAAVATAEPPASSGAYALAALKAPPTPSDANPPVQPSPRGNSQSAPSATGDTGFTPTWETQKHARTYLLGIPAPRGQIVDRNGEPLAQTRVSYNLGISYPTPLTGSDEQVLRYTQEQVLEARRVTGRSTLSLTQEQVLKHYKNRGALPLIIALDLKPGELESFHKENPEHLVLQPVYQRFYPNGPLAAHIIGYAGHAGRISEAPIENNELLWPNAEGREGLEQTFDPQLQGRIGQYNISFDANGNKASEQISVPPQPGYNIVTTLDLHIQQLCEQALEKGCKRGAMVIMDPSTGDILAMASWPEFNPNIFIPSITPEALKTVQDDPDIPLLPRAFRSAYPPGSTFKVFVGLAALETGAVDPDDEFSCPAAMEIGHLTFRNWKHSDSGSMNFVEALTQSCDTWFYQVGMKVGPKPIIDYAEELGLGQRTGIPLKAEAEGRIPSDEFMLKAHGRRIQGGDVANLSIGQGDTEVTPLQLAQAMGAVGMNGALHQTRLVQQVQSVDGQIVTAYDVRVKHQVEIDPEVMKNIRKGMVQVVSSRSGTAGKAQVPNVDVAGKTGTAQWGPKNKERTAAWFAGFAPADKPKYAFAVVYEGDAGLADIHGGTVAAPLVGKVLRDLFKDEKAQKRHRHSDDDDSDDSGDSGDTPPPRRHSHDSDDSQAPTQPVAPRPQQQPRPQLEPFWRRWFH